MFKTIKKFIKNQCGIAAIELAIVLPAFLILVFGIIEFGFIYHVQSTLQGAMQDAARYAMTNNTYDDINTDGLSRPDFIRKVVEKKMGDWVMTGTKILITTQKVNDPTDIDNTTWQNGTQDTMDLGGGGDFIIYRIDYGWQTMTPLVKLMAYLGFKKSDNPELASGTIGLSAVIALKNEEFCNDSSCFGDGNGDTVI
jgi:Flp pilus assembly protein TadG